MPDGAVICVNCGYDKRTGRRIGEPAPSRLGYTIGTSVIAIVAALGVRAYFSRPAPVPQAPPPLAAAPAPIVVQPSKAAPVAAAAPTNSQPTVAAVTSAPAIDTNALARAAREAMEKEKRASLGRQLDTKYPLFVPGETVALRTTNAIVRRGVFKWNTDGALVLAESRTNEIVLAFTEFDVATRLRCDVEFRTRYLERAVEKALK